ncbi:uncharacterized protein EMH_0023890 [Eimeria mitis]|uniref:Uncharacterized protein n=1 Tax=Eimeria mitis TaxID=44415 RepID=U6KI13_9EIME|nr:uncharacterized protein EMH_0023890 [Eimeria mitis]CDJ35108.1 hypothetical protein EMH_0023890 [Eimeria mitis]
MIGVRCFCVPPSHFSSTPKHTRGVFEYVPRSTLLRIPPSHFSSIPKQTRGVFEYVPSSTLLGSGGGQDVPRQEGVLRSAVALLRYLIGASARRRSTKHSSAFAFAGVYLIDGVGASTTVSLWTRLCGLLIGDGCLHARTVAALGKKAFYEAQ